MEKIDDMIIEECIRYKADEVLRTLCSNNTKKFTSGFDKYHVVVDAAVYSKQDMMRRSPATDGVLHLHTMEQHALVSPREEDDSDLAFRMKTNYKEAHFPRRLLSCHGHWFSFENKIGRGTRKCFKEVTTSLKGWKIKIFLIDRRAIPDAMPWRHVISMDTFLKLPTWTETIVSKGDPIPEDQRLKPRAGGSRKKRKVQKQNKPTQSGSKETLSASPIRQAHPEAAKNPATVIPPEVAQGDRMSKR
nr:hypothetical protein [Tanacetum cinerariifolium]